MLEDQCFRGRRSPPSSTLTTTSTTTSQVVKHQNQQQQEFNKISFGQASFDSCYGSDIDNFCCETTTNVSNLCRQYNNNTTSTPAQQQSATTTTDFPVPEQKQYREFESENQKLELTLGVFLSAESNCSDVESEDDVDNNDEEEIFFSHKRPRLTDESILDLIVGSLSESQIASDLLFQNTSSGKNHFPE